MTDFTKMSKKAVHDHRPANETEERERREELWCRDVKLAFERAGMTDAAEAQGRAVAKEIAKAHRFVYEW